METICSMFSFLMKKLIGLVITMSMIEMSSLSFANLENFFDLLGQKKIMVSESDLPKPFDYLLTQPLLTKGLENYYKRIALLTPIQAKMDDKNNIFTRSILMLIDRNAERNNVEQAKLKNETATLEFSTIQMNFNALPNSVINGVLNSNVPFGKLLINQNISIKTTGRTYFKIRCDKTLSEILKCPENTNIYGRTNTILDAKNMTWLAKVTEIISGTLRSDL